MAWDVEYTDEFERWWTGLQETEQDAVDQAVHGLEARGPTLRYPFSCGVRGSRYGNMRELRAQVSGDPYRIFYAFDPRRVAILLIGDNKAGDDRFYERMIPVADRLYGEHLRQLEREDRVNEEK